MVRNNESGATNLEALKAIIIGGGIGGLTCARACLDAGIKVELYERRDFDSMLSGPGGIFIQQNAMGIYQLLWGGSIRDQLYEKGGKIIKGGFFNHQGTLLYLNSAEFVKKNDLGVCILRPELQQILYNALPEGTVRNNSRFVDFEETKEGIRAFFEDGHVAIGDLLIGADGLNSKVKARLNGKEQQESPIYSGMCCWRGKFLGTNLPLDKRYTWAELWGCGDRFGYFHVGGDRFGFYAFRNTEAGGSDRAAGGAKKVLQSIFSDYAEPVRAIIESLDEEMIYRDDIFDRNPLGVKWGSGRVTLIGDAAHPVQPNLGQGGCMAIEDSFELVKQLVFGKARCEDIPSQLRQFEQSRSQRIEKIFNASRQIGKLGQTDTTIGCFLRNWIYRLTPTWLGDLQFKWLFDYQPESQLQ